MKNPKWSVKVVLQLTGPNTENRPYLEHGIEDLAKEGLVDQLVGEFRELLEAALEHGKKVASIGKPVREQTTREMLKDIQSGKLKLDEEQPAETPGSTPETTT
jgi:hypothetical protein